MPSPTENLSTSQGGNNFVPILAESQIRAKPLKSLAIPEPIPDAKGSLTTDQLREIVKHRQPPAEWFAGDEEQLF
jgi:hypothetical protein